MKVLDRFVSHWAGFIVNVVTVSGWGVAAVKSLLYSQENGVVVGNIRVSYEMLAVFPIICALLFVNSWIFGKVLKQVAKRSIDYKVICDTLSGEWKRWIDTSDRASRNLRCADAVVSRKLTEDDFKALLNSPHVTCRRLRADAKVGKTILQCSFIPVDKNGNTIIIRRCCENHESIFKKFNNWLKQIYSFISFSPIPNGYNQAFDDILTCYAHEVPVDCTRDELEFKFVAVIYNRRSGGGREKKRLFPSKSSKSQPKEPVKCIRYLFVVYLVKYRKLVFADERGKVDWANIDSAFTEKSKRGSKRKDRFFLKDHDRIIGVKPLSEIKDSLSDRTDNSAAKKWQKVEQEAIKIAAEILAKEEEEVCC